MPQATVKMAFGQLGVMVGSLTDNVPTYIDLPLLKQIREYKRDHDVAHPVVILAADPGDCS